jgi:hypothetical protein
MLDVVIGLDIGVDWLSTNLEDTTEATADWHRPPVSLGASQSAVRIGAVTRN